MAGSAISLELTSPDKHDAKFIPMRIDSQRATAAASSGRQDLLIPRAGNQLLRSRAGAQPSCYRIWRIKLSHAIS
jgi:hypothetical protein